TPVSLASSQGKITVQLGPKDVKTVAELTLVDRGRSIRDWKLQLPEGAVVEPANESDQKRLRGQIQGKGSKEGLVTIPLKAPSDVPLRVLIKKTHPRGSGPLLLGPFAAVGAASQGGTLWVFPSTEPGQPRERVTRCLPFSFGPATPPLA